MLKNYAVNNVKDMFMKSKILYNKLEDWILLNFKTENDAVD